MFKLDGFLISDELFRGRHSLLFRGVRELDQVPVILKLLRNEYPTPEELARFKREFEITRNLQEVGCIQVYELAKFKNRLFIVEEDFGGASLESLLPSLNLDLDKLLALAIAATDILGRIHRRNIIHMDINPANIVWNPETNVVKLIDFGLSMELPQHSQQVLNPQTLEGTLAYISPEQTGRMNRSMDYRSDLYSLGATLFFLFTGRLPFETTDPAELVHAHIALSPSSPHVLNPDIPVVLSDLILKLLAKTAEERYQTADGVKADLIICRGMLLHSGSIDSFQLAGDDVSDRFQIPAKLYGRERESRLLLDSFERISTDRNELLLVAGYSGVGKSSLIHEIHKPILARNGFFISGKFDQFQHNIPYSAFIQAFREVCVHLLTESAERLAAWKNNLQEALGINAQLIVDVIPELDLVIGPQSPPPAMGFGEAKNRFILTFQYFIAVFAQPDHPLVIFLDDLQWADSASLHLLHSLTTDASSRNILFLGAYRDNEVQPSHPLLMTLDEITNDGGKITTLELSPLTLDSIHELLAETFKSEDEATGLLARLIMNKTGGNPFFVRRFLATLFENRLLVFNSSLRRWLWDIDSIDASGVTDNVIDLMVAKIRQLPGETRRISQYGACLGNSFQLKHLSLICRVSMPNLARNLWPALEEELLVPTGSNHKLLKYMDDDEDTGDMDELIRFQHDRIQQAAYETIALDQRSIIHLQIGRLLLENRELIGLDENLFDIVSQLNMGRTGMHGSPEKTNLARLNLNAATRALDGGAFQPALEHLRTGLSLLPENCWDSDYELAFRLHRHGGECEYLNANQNEANLLFEIGIKNARTDLEKARIYTTRLIQSLGMLKLEESVIQGGKGLALCGITLPALEDFAERIKTERLKIEKGLAGRSHTELLHSPPMNDEITSTTVELLLYTAIAYLYAQKYDGFRITTLLAMGFALTSGNFELSAYVYVCYGMELISNHHYREGYEFGKLAADIIGLYENQREKSAALNVCGAFLFQWCEPVTNCMALLKEGYRIGLEKGELLSASYAMGNLGALYLAGGLPLEEVKKQNDRTMSFVVKNKFLATADPQEILGHLISFLMTDDIRTDLLDLSFAPGQLIRIKSSYVFRELQHYYMQAAFWSGDFQNALQYARESEAILRNGYVTEAENEFLKALCLARLLLDSPESTAGEQEQLLSELEKAKATLAHWAELCPENFTHRFLLVQAEHARFNGNFEASLDFYERAIQHAHSNEFLHHEALANELCALFWLGRKRKQYARSHMIEAHYLYGLWGCTRKVTELRLNYRELLSEQLGHTPRSLTESPSDFSFASVSGIERIMEMLDLTTILKAARAVSSELNLETLLSRLMKLIIENVGAQKAALILLRGEDWLVEAVIDGGLAQTTVLQNQPLARCDSVPVSMVRLVTRSGKPVVLMDAQVNNEFSRDAYIQKNRPRSVLCMSLEREDHIEGALYLENNAAPGAFKEEHISLLQILLSQAIISIQNAYLFQERLKIENEVRVLNRDLEVRVQLRTAELEEAYKELESFSYSVSHDLRGPLRRIIGFTEILREDLEGELNDEQNVMIDRITNSSKNMTELINDLLKLSNISQHRLERTQFDAGILCREIFEELSAGDPGRKAFCDIPTPLDMSGDRELIRILFQDLMENAWKYSSKKTETRIEVGKLNPQQARQILREQNREFINDDVFFVRDSGAGFEMKRVDNIFKPFQRLHTPRDFEGSGIGLATVQRVINRHSGYIWARGEVDIGATFFFTL